MRPAKRGQSLKSLPVAQGRTIVIHRCLQDGDCQRMTLHMMIVGSTVGVVCVTGTVATDLEENFSTTLVE